MTTTLNITGYTVETITPAGTAGTVMEHAYSLTGPRGAHFDVLRDMRTGALWAINLKRSGYVPAALQGNLKRVEVSA
jgi:hypothetical protein